MKAYEVRALNTIQRLTIVFYGEKTKVQLSYDKLSVPILILVDNKIVLVTDECIYYSMCQTGHRSRWLFGGNATRIEAFSIVICFADL